MFNEIIDFFSYSFIWYALGTGISIGIACGFLGPFLVIKNYSLIGDGLSHVGFLALAIGVLLKNLSFFILFPIIFIASLIILEFSEKHEISGDSAIGILSSVSLALGVIIITISSGFNVDVFSFLFGSILFVSFNDFLFSFFIGLFVMITVTLFYNDLLCVSYDEDFSISQGISLKLLKYILALLVSLVITVGIKFLGTLLISSLIIFPTLSAFQTRGSFKSLIFKSCLFSILATFFGLLLSFFLNFPSGASVVVVNAIIFLITFIKKER
ncbi:metal ABC transporter permease [Cetobacterium sp. 2A]|uniref:metal ABC transporter permease n=1 Tax=unclassified Cetobacterium TaxID=2630983 RepID=UPI00163BAF34|nr:metal ABC transporter permease [Cetobacterium sp. 2A]MBC2855152.1 metal ABC transporter permease [Cetobacterium sp. 2A]